MNHKDLKVWNRSIELVIKIYHLAKNLPSDEKYGLNSQIKRSAVSIPSNIAEGAGRSSKKELIRFIDIASGSLSELETQLILVKKLGYYNTNDLTQNEIVVIRKMLYRLKQSLRGSDAVRREL